MAVNSAERWRAPLVVVMSGAGAPMRSTVSLPGTWSGRRNAYHAPLSSTGAGKCSTARTKFSELPAAVDTLKHRHDKRSLQIAARRQQMRLQNP
jgi:hypothetical protein